MSYLLLIDGFLPRFGMIGDVYGANESQHCGALDRPSFFIIGRSVPSIWVSSYVVLETVYVTDIAQW